MKKIFFETGCISILFLFTAFILHNHSGFGPDRIYLTRNIISCGAINASNLSTGVDGLEEISINDNRKPAGEMRDGILYLKLETRIGRWYPETHDGEPLRVYAFAEAGKPLQLPGPVIRVPEGTIINAEIHNTIPGSPLVLHGFYSRPGNPKDSVNIAYD